MYVYVCAHVLVLFTMYDVQLETSTKIYSIRVGTIIQRYHKILFESVQVYICGDELLVFYDYTIDLYF